MSDTSQERETGQRHVDGQNRAHFFGIAAQMMRSTLTDRARVGFPKATLRRSAR
jgi:hypothetical protein